MVDHLTVCMFSLEKTQMNCQTRSFVCLLHSWAAFTFLACRPQKNDMPGVESLVRLACRKCAVDLPTGMRDRIPPELVDLIVSLRYQMGPVVPADQFDIFFDPEFTDTLDFGHAPLLTTTTLVKVVVVYSGHCADF